MAEPERRGYRHQWEDGTRRADPVWRDGSHKIKEYQLGKLSVFRRVTGQRIEYGVKFNTKYLTIAWDQS